MKYLPLSVPVCVFQYHLMSSVEMRSFFFPCSPFLSSTGMILYICLGSPLTPGSCLALFDIPGSYLTERSF